MHYGLKTPYRDGTTHVFEPPDFLARLVVLVPLPRAHLTPITRRIPAPRPSGSLRLCKSATLPVCHGVVAPRSRWRGQVVPGKRGDEKPESTAAQTQPRSGALSWMQRLKPGGQAIDIETCRRCGGRLRVIACIEDPVVIGRILKHLGLLPM